MKTFFRLTVLLIVVIMCACFFTACEKPYYEKETVDSFVSELQESILNVKSAQEAKISELEAEYKADIVELESKNSELQALIDALTEEYTEQIASLKANDQATDNQLENLKTSYEAKVTELNNLISANATKIAALETSLAEEINSIKTTYSAQISDIESLIEDLQEADGDTTDRIEILEEQVAELISKLSPYLAGHTWSEWVIIKSPNSVEDGIAQRFCTDCNYTESKIVSRAEHNFVFAEVVAPASVEEIALIYTCSHCDEVYTETVIPVHFEITSGNRNLIGYTGEETETFVIPVAFYNEGVWYRVTSIGGSAFGGCDFTNVTIPASVTNIGDYAFDCSALTSVTIPDSVTTIGKSAFWQCRDLKTVIIGNGVTNIGEDAFEFCEGLTSITLGNNVNTIGANAFGYCKSLKSIVIPDSVENIGSGAFEECRALESATIGEGITNIPTRLFYCCTSLSDVTISNNLEKINSSAFYYCSNLTTITYKGLIAEWNDILKMSGWNQNTGNYIVKCDDATAEK